MGRVEIGASQFLLFRTFVSRNCRHSPTYALHCACIRVSQTSQPQTPQTPRVLGLQWLFYPMLQLRLPWRAHGRCALRFVGPRNMSTSRMHGSWVVCPHSEHVYFLQSAARDRLWRTPLVAGRKKSFEGLRSSWLSGVMMYTPQYSFSASWGCERFSAVGGNAVAIFGEGALGVCGTLCGLHGGSMEAPMAVSGTPVKFYVFSTQQII